MDVGFERIRSRGFLDGKSGRNRILQKTQELQEIYDGGWKDGFVARMQKGYSHIKRKHKKRKSYYG